MFTVNGFDAFDYGTVCYDKWDEEVEVVDELEVVLNPTWKTGNRYGIRYDELIAFIILAL